MTWYSLRMVEKAWSSFAGNTPMSVLIYSTQRGGNGGPALNALGTIMLVMSFVIAIIGYLGYRFLQGVEWVVHRFS